MKSWTVTTYLRSLKREKDNEDWRIAAKRTNSQQCVAVVYNSESWLLTISSTMVNLMVRAHSKPIFVYDCTLTATPYQIYNALVPFNACRLMRAGIFAYPAVIEDLQRKLRGSGLTPLPAQLTHPLSMHLPWNPPDLPLPKGHRVKGRNPEFIRATQFSAHTSFFEPLLQI